MFCGSMERGIRSRDRYDPARKRSGRWTRASRPCPGFPVQKLPWAVKKGRSESLPPEMTSLQRWIKAGSSSGPGAILPSSSCLQGLIGAKEESGDCLRVSQRKYFPCSFSHNSTASHPEKSRISRETSRWKVSLGTPLFAACRIRWDKARKSPALCLRRFRPGFLRCVGLSGADPVIRSF
jgi:hypothetical protein